MGKAHRKGNAFDNEGDPGYPYRHSMQVEARNRAALSEKDRDDREKAILGKVERGLDAAATRKRFMADTRAALRRAKDSAAATPCSNWSQACPKCKSGRRGDHHHVFCENRATFCTQAEIDLSHELRMDILQYQKDRWHDSGSASQAAGGSATGQSLGAESIDGLPPLMPSVDTQSTPRPVDAHAFRLPQWSDVALPLPDVPPIGSMTPPSAPCSTEGPSSSSMAPLAPRPAELQLGIERGRQQAAVQCQADGGDFVSKESIFGAPVAKTREASWFRVEMSRVMRPIDKAASTSPFPAPTQFRTTIQRDLDQMRTVDGRKVLCRPRPFDFVTHGASITVVNLATARCKEICEMRGWGSLPCGNSDCFGKNGKWHTAQHASVSSG